MKKRLFFGVASFIGFFLLVAWQFAAAELAELQNKRDVPAGVQATEIVYSQSQDRLFI